MEAQRNEKRLRELSKIPANKTCADCNARGPQYVCLDFNTFVCVPCASIHREMNHHVKSISMANFSNAEVSNVKNGGNELHRKLFLARHRRNDMEIPTPEFGEKNARILPNEVHRPSLVLGNWGHGAGS
eukprot:Rmarinus@m.19159